MMEMKAEVKLGWADMKEKGMGEGWELSTSYPGSYHRSGNCLGEWIVLFYQKKEE